MYYRKLIKEINQLKSEFRIITLVGPRQAGKTTLCRQAFPEYEYVSLENPDTKSWAIEDPRAFLKRYRKHVILDEIQRAPSLLSYIQQIVDEDNIKAQYILTGSHQLALSEAVTQSLAGRTALLTLLPLSFSELNPSPLAASEISIEQDLLSGFMPGKHAENVNTVRFYRAYFQTYVERDVRALLQVKDFVKFENFVRLCASRVGQILNQASLATEVGVSTSTIGEWISVLESSFIITRLTPYYENFGKRIIKSPKLYFIDTGLAAWLLGIETEEQMLRDPLRGHLFENMAVIEALKAQLNDGNDPRIYYFRDSHGNEVDLVIQKGRSLVPIEIKAAQTWKNSFLKGIRYFYKITSHRATKGAVVYGGQMKRAADEYQLIHYREIEQLVLDQAQPIHAGSSG